MYNWVKSKDDPQILSENKNWSKIVHKTNFKDSHFCPKMVTFESGSKVVAIYEIW